MMYQCCLIALMIAHCVSLPGQALHRDFPLKYTSYVNADDTQNNSLIEQLTSTTEGEQNNFLINHSGIQPLIEQYIYDDKEQLDDEEDDVDNDPLVTSSADDIRTKENNEKNVAMHHSSVRISTLPDNAILASVTVHESVLTGLSDFEAIKNSFESDSSVFFSENQFQIPKDQQPGKISQPLESILTLTADTAGTSLSTEDFSGLTVSTAAIAADVSLEVTNSNQSLSTQSNVQQPTSNSKLAKIVHKMDNITRPTLLDTIHSYKESINPIPMLTQTQQTTSSSNELLESSSSLLSESRDSATIASLQRHRTINSMNLNPTTPAMVVKPIGEHRKLLKSTGPILNYVFDHHPPYYKSHYYNTRYGPHFETDNVTNITVQNADTLYLSCRISLLQDKTVSWVRRKSGDTALQLLTVGKQTYSGDPRYQIEFQYPNNWRLRISHANKNDEGIYECQISTHPPKVIIYNLHVNAPEVAIVDDEGGPLYDKYYEVGSTIKLMCKIRHISMLRSVVYWIHNDNILNHDTTRGGISVKTNLTNVGANSTLFVAKVNRQDSGSYTCSIGPNQHYSIAVHVLNGTANPYGIYQRSCAFSIIMQAMDLWFVVRSLLFLFLKLCMVR
ncbi:uncharacterized protein LOC128730042 [Anopheles nili]|uniref:uncharacterized protein LOC128730042 n=1 Tax=Anopheles nili TaxID=185578 RepID=UPI00237ABC74|nr:uncharacterized protein LOC128730042 [Anopheles nili]